jgi:hypothetical protein
MRWELDKMAGGPASITNLDLPATHALENALASVWGVRPVYKREGGSVPVVGDMQKILGDRIGTQWFWAARRQPARAQ